MVWFKNLVLGATILALCVVVFGAYVRLTDAGLGCPDWPGCYGTLTVPESVAAIEEAQANYPNSIIDKGKAWIEMIHRYIAAILGLMILSLAFLAYKNKNDSYRATYANYSFASFAWRNDNSWIVNLYYSSPLGVSE